MSFAARLTRSPIAHEADVGADMARRFAGLPPEVAALLGATAGCSPYLRDLMLREEAWLREAIAQPPEAVLDALVGLPALPSDSLAAPLREAKRRVALLVALCDLGGVWALPEVTGALTRLADAAVARCVVSLVADEIRRGKLPGAVPEDAAFGAGMVVFAMGKMGAHELNYSSDIDLICLCDETRYPDAAPEARAAFIRVTRRMAALLSDVTQDGYVFRTDLRLRPDAAVTPVCLSMAAAEAYYEAQGRTWERAAWIKARPCAGDLDAGARFQATLVPFVWRKHLDFAAIEDAHDMRLRIRTHRNLHGPLTLEGHDLKLGQGGIREIEFFTQTRQLIAGGRDPSLRPRGTEAALAALADRGWVPAEVTQELTSHYRAHRELEHRLQMVRDAQTHAMPVTPEGMERIARFCGNADVAAFRQGLLDRLARVEGLTGDFFAPGEVAAAPELPPQMRAIVARWASYPALRSERAASIFRRVRPVLLSRLERSGNPAEALVALDGFLAGLPAGVQLFSLFEANPPLVDLIVDIASTSPSLARYLARNASVLDAVIGGGFFSPWPGEAGLAAEFAVLFAQVGDYEGRLDAARRRMKEWHFRIGVHHLRGLIDADEAQRSYADLATAVVQALVPVVTDQIAARHGPPPGVGASVVAMGSLGAGRLHAASDLDLIVIYDPQGAEASEGPRPLPPRAYFARLTQALVTALNAPTAEGRLYDVDMRLRPSGRQGPVATSLDAFRDYQMTEAWTWEHLALTRARPLTGTLDLQEAIERCRREVLVAKGKEARVLPDAAAMRARLHAARPGTAWDVRDGPGRLLDIELLAETAALRAADPARDPVGQLAAGERAGFLGADEAATLLRAMSLLRSVQTVTRLLTDAPLDPRALGEGGRAFLLRATDAPDIETLAARLAEASTQAAALTSIKLGLADRRKGTSDGK